MSNISTIFAGCETVIQNTLGVSWKRLEHVVKLEENKWGSGSSRWGLMPAAANPISGETRANTISQGFRILLTDAFITTVTGDSEVITKTVSLLGQLETLFKNLVLQKCGAPSVVRHVYSFAYEEALILNKEKIIIVEGKFFVQSQVNF
jgi:hypothetical protein